MKQILHILFYAVIMAGIISCGDRNSNQMAEGSLSSKQKNELKQAAKKIKVRLKEKGNQIIKSVDTPFGTNSTVFTFDGDRCVGCKETMVFPDEAIAKEAFEGMKEINDFNHALKTLSLEGNKIIYEHGLGNLKLMFSNMTRAQVLKQVKEEIEQANEFLK